jgi:peptidase E
VVLSIWMTCYHTRMTTYVLHGGFPQGEAQRDNAFFQEVLREAPSQSHVLLVYFAKEDDRIAKNLEEDTAEFQRNKPTGVELSFETAEEATFIEQVQRADVVYLHGGHTGKLLETITQFSNLKELFEDKIIAGDSAGVNVLCSYFYSLKIGAGQGLSIIPIKVLCHYQQKNGHQLDEYDPTLPTLILRENEYAVYHL